MNFRRDSAHFGVDERFAVVLRVGVLFLFIAVVIAFAHSEPALFEMECVEVQRVDEVEKEVRRRRVALRFAAFALSKVTRRSFALCDAQTPTLQSTQKRTQSGARRLGRLEMRDEVRQ